MWLLLKILIAIGAFGIRLTTPYLRRRLSKEKKLEGTTYFVQKQNKWRRGPFTTLSIQFPCRSVFWVNPESSWDRFFKRMGLTSEFQTGDQKFDRDLYIASDCGAFLRELQRKASVRQAIQRVFEGGANSVACDGATLWFQCSDDRRNDELWARQCIEVYRQLQGIDQKWASHWSDPFARKVMFLEGVIWAVAVYVWSNYVGMIGLTSSERHFYSTQLVRDGIFLGVGLTFGLVGLIFVILRGSARRHRVALEALLALGMSLPFCGPYILSDINMQMDQSDPSVLLATVENLYERVYARRYGRKDIDNYMKIKPVAAIPGLDVPTDIQIERSTYLLLLPGQKVLITTGRGYLGYPWYRSIVPVNEKLSPGGSTRAR